MNPIADPSNRRFIAFLAALIIGALNKKLGLDLSEVEMAELLAFVLAYIGQSTVKELKKAKAAGEAAAAEVDSPQAALDVMNAVTGDSPLKGPQP